MQLYMRGGCVIIPFADVGDAMEALSGLKEFLSKRKRPPFFLGLPINTDAIVDDKLIVLLRTHWYVLEKGKKRKHEVEKAFLILPVQGVLKESFFKNNQLIKAESLTIDGTKKQLARYKNNLRAIEDKWVILHRSSRPDWLYNGKYITNFQLPQVY